MNIDRLNNSIINREGEGATFPEMALDVDVVLIRKVEPIPGGGVKPIRGRYEVLARQSDFSSSLPNSGDPCTVRGKNWKIVDVEPDLYGMVTLTLKELS